MIIEDFTQIYQRLNKDNLELLTDLYSADITFIDPLHRIEGIDNLTVYFLQVYMTMFPPSLLISKKLHRIKTVIS